MVYFLHIGDLFRALHRWEDLTFASFFGISLTLPPPLPAIVVVWRTLPMGSYKINTNGYVKNGFASGGGINRDHTRNCIRVFSVSYGPCLNLEVKLRAIIYGILLARGVGISTIWVYADLSVAIHCITRGGGPWKIQGTFRQIRDLISFDRDMVSHIYRKEN